MADVRMTLGLIKTNLDAINKQYEEIAYTIHERVTDCQSLELAAALDNKIDVLAGHMNVRLLAVTGLTACLRTPRPVPFNPPKSE